MEKRLRLRSQTWQRHHGFSESLRESDERGKNVHIGVVGESCELSPFAVCKLEKVSVMLLVGIFPFFNSGEKGKPLNTPYRVP